MQFDFDFNARQFESLLGTAKRKAEQAAEEALHDVSDELTRIASEITPHDKGILQRSHTKKFTKNSEGFKSEIDFSVKEGDFNYALWIHEGIYKHGAGTEGRSGTVGWSGKRYYVGRKYLERPMKGEEQAFYEYIGRKISEAVGD